MKIIKYTVAAVLLSGVSHAQGLFDVNPNEIEEESLPLTYNANLGFGYDDNVNPASAGPERSSSYLKGSIGANLVVRNEQTSWDINAAVTATNYFEEVRDDKTVYSANLAFNLNHRISDRLRYVTRNFFNYGLDLNTFYGPITSREINEYTYFSTDNALGYRWTERLATYTGIAYSIVDYDGSSRDVSRYTFYNQFRYTLSEISVLTAAIRYNISDYDTTDKDRVTLSVGLERALSDTSSVVFNVGAQFAESTSAYGSLSYINKINTQLKARVFARYSQEDTDTVIAGDRYEDKTAFRFGAAADYILSPELTFTIGGNYTMSNYEGATTLADGDWTLFNVYVGATYSINSNLSVRVSANHTTSDSTVIPNRDYDRNRYELGLNYSF